MFPLEHGQVLHDQASSREDKWLKMKLIALHKSIDHLLDDRDQASMMKVSYCIVPQAYIRVSKNAAMSLVWDQY